ncbi:MAG: cell division protein FtsQ/DivIB [Pseudomonadota bacterium]
MRPLTGRQPAPEAEAPRARAKAPVRRSRFFAGPSKLAYRLTRAWAQPGVRAAVTLYLPVALAALVAWRVIADDGLRQAAEDRIAAAWDGVKARPEFTLKGVVIDGVPSRLRAEVHRTLALPVGQSSLALDLDALRVAVEAMGGVAEAAVRLDPGGVLHVAVTPRPAVALWRAPPGWTERRADPVPHTLETPPPPRPARIDPDGDGPLFRIAEDGTIIAPVSRRAAWPDLPVLVGAGARAAVPEALALVRAGPEIADRLRAVVRVGERRWDVVLSGEPGRSGGDVRIMLPEAAPRAALARVLALHYGQELLDRDVAAVDMRLPARPMVQVRTRALEAMRLRRALDAAEREAL